MAEKASTSKPESANVKGNDDDKRDQPKRKLRKNGAEKSEEFPNTLQGFNYRFNEEGKMRHTETDSAFEMAVTEDATYNQKRYEALGEVITQHVYKLLETEAGLHKINIPVDHNESEPHTFIFASDNAQSKEKLLILIHGSGVVRAGQWARRLIINDCLDSGTQLPFIKRALAHGYGVLVLNTNDNIGIVNAKKVKIRGNESPEEHVKYVWKNIISKSKAVNIAIIAHSYGGVCVVDLVKSYGEEMAKRVFAIAFTDSVHSLGHQDVSQSGTDWLKKVARNWVSSKEPLDTNVPTPRRVDIPRVSAGDTRHEMTSWSSIESIFKFLDEKYKEIAPQMKSDL